MVSVIASWIYIFILCSLLGFGTRKVIFFLFQKKETENLAAMFVTGVVVTTVYAQFFSLFYKVGLIANLLLFVVAVGILVYYRVMLLQYAKKCWKQLRSWEGFLYLLVVIGCAYFTSRGNFHTDTGIYHAQAIRWLEEFGVVKGLGNLQLHFAYNSSCFAYAALFSLKFLTGQSLHTTNGLIAAFLCVYSLYQLKDFTRHTKHMADFCCAAMLFYTIVMAAGMMSPASDYMTMFLALYVITAWAKELERDIPDQMNFLLLSVLTAFIVTLKLSAAMLVLLMIKPLVQFIREKKWKQIGVSATMVFLIVIPFLIRNVIISGWLIYPFAGIDLFNVDWKIPLASLIHDSNQIKVWGRCLYDVTLVNLSWKQWLPIWWEAQERYAQMLIYANVLALVLDVATFFHLLKTEKKIYPDRILLKTAVYSSMLVWFFLAPFIRYGLAFLLAAPAIAVGTVWKKQQSSLYKLFVGACIIGVILSLNPYLDHYVTDDGVFAKQNLSGNYYVMQKDYEQVAVKEIKISGLTFYTPDGGEQLFYHSFPGASYEGMLEGAELRGETLADGFRAKSN